MNPIRASHGNAPLRRGLLADPRLWLRISGWTLAIALPLAFIGFMTLPLSVSPAAIALVPLALGLAIALFITLRSARAGLADLERREAEPPSR